ncbi:MAG: hypothetical protein ACREBC_30890, partial [Pyrinomonadaceae bacterium]
MKIPLIFFLPIAFAIDAHALSLTVITDPPDARVRIMNIKPRYLPGIDLQPGRYDIQVSKSGYHTYRHWIDLGQEDRVLEVSLRSAVSGLTALPVGQEVQVGRYSTLAPVPVSFPPAVAQASSGAFNAKAADQALLDRLVRTRPTQSADNLGSAMRELLQGSGYRLAQGEVADPRLPALLALPLPEAHRDLGPLSIREALKTLAGP